MNQKKRDDPQLESTLNVIVEGTAQAKGEHFFQMLVRYLAASLDSKVAFIGEFSAERTAVKTISVWIDDHHEPNFEFALEGTPCRQILSGEIQHFADDVQASFPTNPLLKQLDARSYLAIPLADGNGEVIGHLAVIDDKPKKADDRELSIFHIFAARATAELLRRQAERDLSDSRLRVDRLQSERQRMEAEMLYLREELGSRTEYSEIVGESDAIWKVIRDIDSVAKIETTVLILGETGTGKELVARAIHRNSTRSNGPFIRVNCAGLPESLIESELFGHEHGAFTGATQQRSGRFELADGGTIFLDEIGEMPLAAQARLLRVLQERELERVGSSHTIQIDTRVLAATNRNLLDMVDDGTFREDLYYRLNVFPIQVPALRERKEDIPTLVRCFLTRLSSRLGKKIERVSDSVLATLREYSWPGNVRELENIVERSMILTRGDTLQLPPSIIPVQQRKDRQNNELRLLEDVERDHIQHVLDHTRGVIAGPNGAAVILGLNSNTLRSRMAKLGVMSERSRSK